MKKKPYIAPVVELVQAKIEKGFAGSGNGDLEPVTPGGDISGDFGM